MDENSDSPRITSYRKETTETLNSMYKRLTQLFTFQMHLGIYRMVMRDLVPIRDIADCFGVSPQWIYHVVDNFKKSSGELDEEVLPMP